jgi:hypothetical protein
MIWKETSMTQPLAEAIAMKTMGIKPCKSELVGDELALDQLHGDEDSNEEFAGEDEIGSEMEEERSGFDCGDLEEHVIVNDDQDGDEDGLDENDLKWRQRSCG